MSERATGLSPRDSVLLGVAIGVLAGLLAAFLLPLGEYPDFNAFHHASRAWLDGRDPYAVDLPLRRGDGSIMNVPYFYPFPTVLAVAPFARLPMFTAGAIFVGVTSAVLGYAVARRSPERLPMFLGAGFLVAVGLGQWSPLITATALLPSIAWLAVLKPNLGLAVTLARPSRIAILGGGLLLAATLALQPTWPRDWLENLRSMPSHPSPLFVPGGALALVALLRWRRPEARLIVAMACVPQLMFFADQLPLWLVPRTRRETMMLSAASGVAWLGAMIMATRAESHPAFASAHWVLLGVYLPTLIMVLRRPNEGAVPRAIERAIAHLPLTLRGSAGSAEEKGWPAGAAGPAHLEA